MRARMRGLGVIGVAVLVGAVALSIALGLLSSRPAEPAPATLLAASSPETDWSTTTTTTAPPPPPPTTVTAPTPAPKPAVVHHQAPAQPTHQANYAAGTGGFAACVRQHESGGNYGYNDGRYHGAYNMTTDHWGGYGGYARPEDAPPSVQDAKFQDDMSHGSGYLHQQYPVTSRMCGG